MICYAMLIDGCILCLVSNILYQYIIDINNMILTNGQKQFHFQALKAQIKLQVFDNHWHLCWIVV